MKVPKSKIDYLFCEHTSDMLLENSAPDIILQKGLNSMTKYCGLIWILIIFQSITCSEFNEIPLLALASNLTLLTSNELPQDYTQLRKEIEKTYILQYQLNIIKAAETNNKTLFSKTVKRSLSNISTYMNKYKPGIIAKEVISFLYERRFEDIIENRKPDETGFGLIGSYLHANHWIKVASIVEILDKITTQYTDKTQPLVIASLFSGRLEYEYIVCHFLNKWGYEKIILQCLDIIYEEKNQAKMHTLFSSYFTQQPPQLLFTDKDINKKSGSYIALILHDTLKNIIASCKNNRADVVLLIQPSVMHMRYTTPGVIDYLIQGKNNILYTDNIKQSLYFSITFPYNVENISISGYHKSQPNSILLDFMSMLVSTTQSREDVITSFFNNLPQGILPENATFVIGTNSRLMLMDFIHNAAKPDAIVYKFIAAPPEEAIVDTQEIFITPYISAGDYAYNSKTKRFEKSEEKYDL